MLSVAMLVWIVASWDFDLLTRVSKSGWEGGSGWASARSVDRSNISGGSWIMLNMVLPFDGLQSPVGAVSKNTLYCPKRMAVRFPIGFPAPLFGWKRVS